MKLIPQTYAQDIQPPSQLSQVYSSGSGPAFATLLANLWRTMIILGGIALIIYLVWGGAAWVMSGGDKEKLEKARNRIMHAIIGMTILAASVAIIIFLRDMFGINLLQPNFPDVRGTP